MYEEMLSSKAATALAALVASLLAAAIVGRRGLWWRGLAYNFAPALAAGFFAAMLVLPADGGAARGGDVSLDLAACLALEAVVLVASYALLHRLMVESGRVDLATTERFLRVTLLGQVALVGAQLALDGFGIFSEGLRIDYLYQGASGKYLTYASALIAAAQAALVARRISLAGRPGRIGLAVMALLFVLSLTSGSKGAFFLWAVAMLALVDTTGFRRSLRPLLVVGVSLGALFLVSSTVVAGFLGLEFDAFIDLVANRFFLTNDARALALDHRTSATADAGLFLHAFRSTSTLFGTAPVDPPLGVHLYEFLFGGDTFGAGANASLAALILFYTPAGSAWLPCTLAIAAVVALALALRTVVSMSREPAHRVLLLSFGLLAMHQCTQDFLAFQVVVPLALVLAALGLAIRGRRVRRAAAARPLAPAT